MVGFECRPWSQRLLNPSRFSILLAFITLFDFWCPRALKQLLVRDYINASHRFLYAHSSYVSLAQCQNNNCPTAPTASGTSTAPTTSTASAQQLSNQAGSSKTEHSPPQRYDTEDLGFRLLNLEPRKPLWQKIAERRAREQARQASAQASSITTTTIPAPDQALHPATSNSGVSGSCDRQTKAPEPRNNTDLLGEDTAIFAFNDMFPALIPEIPTLPDEFIDLVTLWYSQLTAHQQES